MSRLVFSIRHCCPALFELAVLCMSTIVEKRFIAIIFNRVFLDINSRIDEFCGLFAEVSSDPDHFASVNFNCTHWPKNIGFGKGL